MSAVEERSNGRQEAKKEHGDVEGKSRIITKTRVRIGGDMLCSGLKGTKSGAVHRSRDQSIQIHGNDTTYAVPADASYQLTF